MTRPLRPTQMDGLMNATLLPKKGKKNTAPPLTVLMVHRADRMLRVRDLADEAARSRVEYVRDLARDYKVAV